MDCRWTSCLYSSSVHEWEKSRPGNKGDWGKFTSTKSQGKKPKPKELNFYAFPSNLPLLVTFGGKCSFWNQLYYSTLRWLLVYSIDPSQLYVPFSVWSCPHHTRLVTVRGLSEKDLNAISKARQSSCQKHCELRKAVLVAQEGWDSGFLFLNFAHFTSS